MTWQEFDVCRRSAFRLNVIAGLENWNNHFCSITEAKWLLLNFSFFCPSSFLPSIQITVWKRYSDFRKLHQNLWQLHKTLCNQSELFPPFARAKVFGKKGSVFILGLSIFKNHFNLHLACFSCLFVPFVRIAEHVWVFYASTTRWRNNIDNTTLTVMSWLMWIYWTLGCISLLCSVEVK